MFFKMSGSSSFPYKKLVEYINEPYPGRLPIKKKGEIKTQGELEATQIVVSQNTSNYKTGANEKEKVNNNIYSCLDEIYKTNPCDFDEFLVENVEYSTLNRWLNLKEKEIELKSKSDFFWDRTFWENESFLIEKHVSIVY